MAGRTFTSGEELAAALEAAAARVTPAIRSANRHEATLLRALIQMNASGRPGPNVITGRYRDSWRIVSKTIAAGSETVVGTQAPQARRLEFGFTGTDSLGRVYDQPPYEHVGPAVQTFQNKYPTQIRKAVEEAFR